MLATCETTTSPSRRNGGANGGRASPSSIAIIGLTPPPLFAASDIDIRRAGLLERETHEFASPLDIRPIIELIRHLLASLAEQRYPRAMAGASADPASRPHAVGGFDVTARGVEELAVGRMVARFDPFDTGLNRGMPLAR